MTIFDFRARKMDLKGLYQNKVQRRLKWQIFEILITNSITYAHKHNMFYFFYLNNEYIILFL